MNFDYHRSFNLWIVKTNPRNAAHHSLHTNTSPYVLARSVAGGDTVVAALSGDVLETWEEKDGSWVLTKSRATLRTDAVWHDGEKRFSDGDSVEIRVSSHLGRAALLGEDGAEDAFGNAVLLDMFIEHLSGNCAWNYAPIDAVPDASRHSGKIVARKSDGPWTIDRVVEGTSYQS